MNAIMTLFPYKWFGVWVFDDDNKDLYREAFVSGMSEIIQKVIDKELEENVDEGFILHFSSQPFPGYQAKIDRTREEFGGNWYHWEDEDMDGWLCPALFCYFDEAPDSIYVQAKLAK